MQKILKRFILYTALMLSLNLIGQWRTVEQNLVWIGTSVQLKLPKAYTLGLAAEERRYVFPDKRHQRILSSFYANKILKQHWKVEAGLWFFEISQPETPFEATVGELKEIRPYFSVSYNRPMKEGEWGVRLQSEYRSFRGLTANSHFEGPIISRRLRQRIRIQYKYPLENHQNLVLAEELHLTVASNPQRSVFQQNRLIAQYHISWGRHLSSAIGYIFWLQPTGREAEYFTRHILTLGLNYNFLLTK